MLFATATGEQLGQFRGQAEGRAVAQKDRLEGRQGWCDRRRGGHHWLQRFERQAEEIDQGLASGQPFLDRGLREAQAQLRGRQVKVRPGRCRVGEARG